MKIIVFVGLFFLLFTSCSTKTSLTYHPIIQEQSKNYVCISIDNFQDTRSSPQQIGALRNGYGMAIVKIITDDDIPLWMKIALEKELTNAGYSITREEGKDVYHIKGKIINFDSGTYFTYHGKISIQMALNRGEKVLFEQTYVSNENVGLCWQLSPFINSSKQAMKCSHALMLNLQKIYQQFIDDINKHLLHHAPNIDESVVLNN